MKIISSWLLVIGMFITYNSYSQNQLIVRDKWTKEPIQKVNIKQGSIKGQSDPNGAINVVVNADVYLSHIAYKPLFIKASDLSKLLEEGFIELDPQTDNIMAPITVYSVKGRPNKQIAKLSNGDWVQHDAGQVLQQIPGFSSVKKSGAFGFDPVFRGFKWEQVAVVTDGCVTCLTACPNRMDPPAAQILVSQVDNIELIKGPHSFRYGPAFGAVVNFRSSVPEFSTKPIAYGRINAGGETNGEIYRGEGLVGIKTKVANIAAIGSYSIGHDYRDGFDSTIPANFKRASAGINSNFLVKNKNLLNLTVTRNFARNTEFPTLMMDLIGDDTWLLQAGYKAIGSGKWFTTWETQAYTSFVDHVMSNELRKNLTVNAKTEANTNVVGARSEVNIKRSASNLYMGVDFKHEAEDGNRVRKPLTGAMAGKTIIDTIWQNSYINRGGAFAEWSRIVNQYQINLSGRLDVVEGNAKTPSAKFNALYKDLSNVDVNPSMSIGITRQWSGRWFTGLWLGRGVRSASITERYINSLQIGIDPYEMMGNPLIKPEKNNQLDLVTQYANNNTVIKMNLFGSYVQDYISAVKNAALKPIFGAPGVRQYVNIDKAIMLGFDISWQQSMGKYFKHLFTVDYTYGQNAVAKIPLPQIKPLDIRYLLEGYFLSQKLVPYLQFRYSAEQNRVATDFGEAKTPSFFVANAGVKYNINNDLQFTFAINNIFDKGYREHLSRPINSSLYLTEPGRSFLIMLSYKF